MTTARAEIRCKVSPTRASYRAVKDDAGASAEDDSSLARRLATGEAGAFERLVEVYQARVARVAHRLLGYSGQSDVEDTVQDVFLAALSHANRVRGERGVWPWLARVTVNACRTRRRRAWVRDIFLGRQRATASVSVSRDASAAAEDREALRRVRDAIDRLPRRDREVIVLHCLEEMRLSDVAAVLGASANAVHVRLHRARQRLQAELGTEK